MNFKVKLRLTIQNLSLMCSNKTMQVLSAFSHDYYQSHDKI